jgi:cytochrome c oxidase subunit I+III
MLITMLAVFTAFISIVFAYFFYWTIHEDFPPQSVSGPGVVWPTTAAAMVLGSWLLTIAARKWNRQDRAGLFYAALGGAGFLAIGGGAAILVGPWLTGLDPTTHVYPATVWLLALWTAVHAGVGLIMQIYCVARRLAGRMTAEHDIDIQNVTLFWHFVAVTAVITVGVISGFPLVK